MEQDQDQEPASPTPRELEILKVLWDLGPSTVRIVHQHAFRAQGVAYNTVQTLLRLMADKKRLVRADMDGRTFVYTPLLSRDEFAVRFVDRIFDGAAAELVQSLLRSESVSADELEQMRAMIDDARRKKGVRHE